VELHAYSERDRTRTDHLRSAARNLGWRQASPLELDQLAMVRAALAEGPR
jgi:hypothetical protein